MTKTKEKKAPNVLSRKQQQLIMSGCELLDNKAQLTSDWNRIIKPELILLFEDFGSTLTGLSLVKKSTHYQINKNTKEYICLIVKTLKNNIQNCLKNSLKRILEQ